MRSRPQPFFAAIFGFLVFLFFFLLSHHEKKQGATVGGSSRKTLRRKSHKKATGGEISREMLKSKSLFKATAKQVEKRDMKGGVVFKSITSVKKEDLKGLVDNLPENIESISYEEAIKGREKLVDILHDAGVEDMDIASIMSLPMWETVQRLYGDGPVLVGLDTCERFRETIPVNDASIGIAGMFNTGTNPFNMYLEANCIMPQNKREAHGGMRWQVPWGKHTPVSRKWSHTAGHEGKVNKTNVLPVVSERLYVRGYLRLLFLKTDKSFFNRLL